MLPIAKQITPDSPEEVAAAIREASATGTPVYPIAGGTMPGLGAYPTRPGVGLAMSSLNRIVDFPSRDLTVSVEAGCPVAEIDRLLAVKRLRLPIDIPHRDRATIGGAISANVSGPRRFSRGTFRDYVVGMEAVDGLGVEFRCGGHVVKNVAGYDHGKLLIGSLGTLGVITRVTMTVRPIPETSRFAVFGLPSMAVAKTLFERLIQTKTSPAAIEWLVGPAWRNDPALGVCAASACGCLAVGFEGTEAEVDGMVERLPSEFGEAGVPSPTIVAGLDAESLWLRLADFQAESSEHVLTIAAHVLPTQSAAAVQAILKCSPDFSLQVHAGNGAIVARCELTDPVHTRSLLNGQLRPAISALGGNVTVLRHARASALAIHDVWGPRGNTFPVAQALKQQFDPRNVLNPGRYIFESP